MRPDDPFPVSMHAYQTSCLSPEKYYFRMDFGDSCVVFHVQIHSENVPRPSNAA
jgi:hypothetical protein